MAELIGVTSGLLAITIAAFNSCTLLYQEVKAFRGTEKNIRDLEEELGALREVLQNLKQSITDNTPGLADLEAPLRSCAEVCSDFQVVVTKCTLHSGGGRTSVRDWAKLRFLGDDIAGFKDLLARYKSTITIALCGANLRSVTATANALEEYHELIVKTTLNLEGYVQKVDSRLQNLPLSGAVVSDEAAVERGWMQKEMDSTRECLTICAKVSEQVDQFRLKVFEDVCTAYGARQMHVTTHGDLPSAKRIIVEGFEEWKGALTKTAGNLEEHLFKVDNRPASSSFHKNEMLSNDVDAQKRTRDDMKQCLSVCTQASEQVEQVRVNVAEDMSAGPNAFQVVVSTLDALLSAKRVTVETGGRQVVGQMSDDSFQQLLRVEGMARRAATDTAVGQQNHVVKKFEGQYGVGQVCGGIR